MSHTILKLSALALMLGGCTTTGNVERNAGAGAAIGAIAGAVIGNNTGNGEAGDGAAIGAVVGGTAGAVRGYSLDQRQRECNQVSRNQQYRDANGRYYYQVPGTSRTCWVSNQRPRGL
jgi:uncharacterized protein YcfJ